MLSRPTWSQRRAAVLAFLLALAMLAGAFWLAIRNTGRLVADAGWRQHTYQVIGEVRGLLGALTDAETGERGYMLTGDERFLEPYLSGAAAVPAGLARLRALTADNPSQRRRLDVLAPAASAELDGLDRSIARRRALGAAAGSLADRLAGKGRMDGLRARLAEMEGAETALLAARDRALLASIRRTRLSLLAGAALGIALLAAAFGALAREIGQRQRAEQALRGLNTRLETANHELEDFCHSVSHDLRAPLRAIDGFSQALLEDAGERLAPADHETLGRVRAAAQRMSGLIDDLLRLSRISRTKPAPSEVDLSALAGAVVEELRRGEPARRAVVDIQDGVRALGDGRLLRVALENLLGNAWKFTRRRPEARIAFGAENGAPRPVYFVRDNGAGFDMTYAGKLFGAFQRLHSGRDFEGNGIGLATVARVVHMHGGRIWAEAAVDQGATFRFTLDDTGGGLAAAEEATP
jgi:signal transduction histidine kinase